jgi:predicted acyltransferase
LSVAAAPAAGAPAVEPRLDALDVLRGLTVAGMLVVNTPGTWEHAYPQLLHAEWNGWTYTDTIFPFFLFIVGVSMEISFTRRSDSGTTPADLLRHTAARGAAIFGIGLALNALSYVLFHKEHLRISGVLQRIGICFLAAGLIRLLLGRRGVLPAAVTLLLLYWGLMTLVPVPGFGAGRLDVEGNLAAYVDRLVLGAHTWKPGWDPEGPLSTLPAIATTLFGAMAGALLSARMELRRKIPVLLAAGAAGAAIGALWGTVFPINKNLWTSSYAVFMSGLAAIALAVCLWIVDARGRKAWAMPFRWLGRNALAIFTLSLLAVLMLLWVKIPDSAGKPRSLYLTIYRTIFDRFADPRLGSLLFALAFLAVFVALAGWMSRRRIFLKL